MRPGLPPEDGVEQLLRLVASLLPRGAGGMGVLGVRRLVTRTGTAHERDPVLVRVEFFAPLISGPHVPDLVVAVRVGRDDFRGPVAVVLLGGSEDQGVAVP